MRDLLFVVHLLGLSDLERADNRAMVAQGVPLSRIERQTRPGPLRESRGGEQVIGRVATRAAANPAEVEGDATALADDDDRDSVGALRQPPPQLRIPALPTAVQRPPAAASSLLAEAIVALPDETREPMALAFSDHLATNCMLTCYAFGWRRLVPLFSVRGFRHVPRG